MEVCLPTTARFGLSARDNVGHIYDIPVEWGYDSPQINSGGYYSAGKKVTVLRCICGEETDRPPTKSKGE